MYKARGNGYVSIEDIPKYFGKNISIIGLIDKVRVIRTKKNERMAFMFISDDTSSCDIALFPKTFEKYKDIDQGRIVLIDGNVQKRFDTYQVSAHRIKVL